MTIFGYFLVASLAGAGVRCSEWWIHRRHRRWILSQQGYESGGRWHRWFFAATWIVPVCGLLEFAQQWWRPPTFWLTTGLLLVLLSLGLRFWTLRVRGPFWNIGRAVIPGYHHRLNLGPYRLWARPDLVGWGAESAGLLMILGTPVTLGANLLILLVIAFMIQRSAGTRFDEIRISDVISEA